VLLNQQDDRFLNEFIQDLFEKGLIKGKQKEKLQTIIKYILYVRNKFIFNK
jgi:hypothetical protein